jgi:hypothetical protein
VRIRCEQLVLRCRLVMRREQVEGTMNVVLTNRGMRDEEAKRSHRQGSEASVDNLDRVLAP